MGYLTLLLPILIILPLLIFLILLNVIAVSYSELGLSQASATVLLIVTLLGSMINIPISRRQVVYEEPQTFLSRFFFYLPPRVATQTVAINVGGALIPALFAIYLLPRAPLWETLVATTAIIGVFLTGTIAVLITAL